MTEKEIKEFTELTAREASSISHMVMNSQPVIPAESL